ncbi:MAG: cbb3-type cytochrome oxidase assembly protein CcoS [Burkholderiaceae bacterium]|nr:cbb3-type cytochrome oxidase assembly protein CcoS [Burkholderiaceae bacterium]
MDVLYLLVPMSVVAMLGILAVFAWALHGGQFEEIDAVGAQILESSDAPLGAALDSDQPASGRALEKSATVSINSQRSSP